MGNPAEKTTGHPDTEACTQLGDRSNENSGYWVKRPRFTGMKSGEMPARSDDLRPAVNLSAISVLEEIQPKLMFVVFHNRLNGFRQLESQNFNHPLIGSKTCKPLTKGGYQASPFSLGDAFSD